MEKKNIIIIGVIILIAISIWFFALRPDPGQPLVNFECENLEKAVAETLNISAGEITKEDMLKLDELVVPGARLEKREKITDLTGLEYAVNLTFLHLSDNQITDITPLVGLVNLEVFYLSHNPLGEKAKQYIETLRARGVDVIF